MACPADRQVQALGARGHAGVEVTEAAFSGSCCSLHFPQLHCQAALWNRRAKNLLIPSVVLGLGAFSVLLRSCSFQISRFRWAKLGLLHLNVLLDSGHGFGSYSQVCCPHLHCRSFGAEAGEKCRMGDCCPGVTCRCTSAGMVRSSTWHALLLVQDKFLRVSWDRVLCGHAGYSGSSCVPADTCRDILGLAPLPQDSVVPDCVFV